MICLLSWFPRMSVILSGYLTCQSIVPAVTTPAINPDIVMGYWWSRSRKLQHSADSAGDCAEQAAMHFTPMAWSVLCMGEPLQIARSLLTGLP